MWWARLLNNAVAVYAPYVVPVTNSYESIATVTVGSGGSSSISFSSIPSTYKHLQIRMITRTSGSGVVRTAYARFNSDTGSNYSLHLLYGTGSSAAAGAATSTSFFTAGQIAGAGATSSVFAGSVVDILDYADTNKYKTTRTLAGIDSNGSGEVGIQSGNWRSTSAVSSILIYPEAGDFQQYSSFALYGIKG